MRKTKQAMTKAVSWRRSMTEVNDILVRGEELFIVADCRWGMRPGLPGKLVLTSDRIVFLHELEANSFQLPIAQRRTVTPQPGGAHAFQITGVLIETANGGDLFSGLAPNAACEIATTVAHSLAATLYPADTAMQERFAQRAAKIKSRTRAARRTVRQPLRKVPLGERLTAAGERLSPSTNRTRRSVWVFWWSR
jgi:hypothetical protein